MSWHENRKKREEMHYIIYGELVKDGIIAPCSDDTMRPWDYEPYLKVYNDMRVSGQDIEDFTTPNSAALYIVDRANDKYGAPETTSAATVVEAGATIDYGVIQMRFSLSREFVTHSEQQRQRAWSKLMDEIMDMHRIASDNMPAVAQASRGQPPGQTTQTIQTTHLRKEFYKDKWRIKLLGGSWSKHGVPVYPEMFEALGINPDELEPGDHEFVMSVGVLVSSSGKPLKVIAGNVQ